MTDRTEQEEAPLKYKAAMKKARQMFTQITGYDSDPAWYRFRKALVDLNMVSPHMSSEILLANVGKAAKIRKKSPLAGICFKQVLKFYLQEEQFVTQLAGRTIKGEELMSLIRERGVSIANSTRSLWFEELGGYSKRREYHPHEVQHILFLAALYLAKKEKDQNK